MLEAQRARGPDDRATGRPESGPFLGAVRLAVMDPTAAGRQPMESRATGDWIVFNGEVYNHREVRAALPRAFDFRSGSDTETVLAAYAAWGEGCLPRLRGMFAFAIWDARARRLFCARDRMGMKPFYYVESDEGFAFASSVGALRRSGLVARDLDRSALAGFVRYGCVQEPDGLLAGVRSLPAAHAMRVEGRGAGRPYRWWSPPAADDPPDDASLRDRFEDAVAEHLTSDVPVASFLSGGVDSSAVTAVAGRRSSSAVAAFTVAWGDDPAIDESGSAGAFARTRGIDHRVVRMSDAEAARGVPTAVAAMDLPTIDGLNTWIVSGAAADAGFKVALSGLGGDELFGGYPTFRRLARLHRARLALRLAPAPLLRTVARSGDRARTLEALGPATLLERYRTLRSLWSREEVRSFGLEPRDDDAADGPDEADDPRLPLATRVSRFELARYMRSMLLRDADALGMARSLEVRVPFLDHRLVEHALRSRPPVAASGKRAFRAAVSDVVPAAASGPKTGFVLPMDRWLRGPLRGFADAGIEALLREDVLDASTVRGVADAFERQDVRWSRPWSLCVLGHWLAATRARDEAAA
jgi:asparagine synthase (glutamine-hydrolysing)